MKYKKTVLHDSPFLFMSEKQPETNKKIEQQIITFLLITFGLSSIFYYFLAYDGKLFAGGGLYILGLMCCPGLSAIITQLIYSKNLRNFGWGWGNTKYQIWSFAIPFLYALVTYTIIWNTGLGRFYNGDFGDSVSDDLSKIVGISNQSSYVLIGVLGLLWILLSALGEEIGWRGFLVPKLAKITTFSKTALISGIIWAVWHYPLIFYTDYNGGTTTWYSILCFTAMVIGISFAFAWLRLKSGSLWTGVFLHASDNLFIQGVFDSLTSETGVTKYVVGEFGFALAIASLVVGYIFWKKSSEISAITPQSQNVIGLNSAVFKRKDVLTSRFN